MGNTTRQPAAGARAAVRTTWLSAMVTVALLLAHDAAAQSAADWAKSLAQKLKKPAPAPAQTPAPADVAAASDSAAAGTSIRSPASAQELFAKRTVNGEELMLELTALHAAATDPKAAASLSSMFGQTSSQLAGAGGFDATDLVTGPLANKLLSGDVSYSNGPLNGFFKELTGDGNALRKETIELPKDSMTATQQETVLVMAALVVAARVAHKTLEEAQKDYKKLESEYAALLVQRQKIAELLADVLDKRRKALAAKDELEARKMQRDLEQWLSADDIKFIDSFGADRPLRDFANDLGLQNLAIKFLQHSDPERYKDYQATSAGLVARSHAYLRTTAGVAAFGGFTVVFAQEVGKTVKDRNLGQIFRVLPFAGKFLWEAEPLIALSADTLYSGVILEPKRSSIHYRLAQGGTEKDAKHAEDVFKEIDKSGDAQLFADALYRNQTPGFIYHVYFCDRAEAGRLIDITVPAADRKQFAESYLNMASGDGFRFTNALADDDALPPARLAEPLLSRDQRSVAESVKIGQLQKTSVANYKMLKDDQLTRLILANSEGPYAQMQLGSTLVHLVPSMSTVYAYENYADHCNKAANGDTARPAKSAKPTTATSR